MFYLADQKMLVHREKILFWGVGWSIIRSNEWTTKKSCRKMSRNLINSIDYAYLFNVSDFQTQINVKL